MFNILQRTHTHAHTHTHTPHTHTHTHTHSWNKSLLWDSSWASEQFYGNFMEMVAKKAFNSEVFDSIIAEFKESLKKKGSEKKNL